MVNIQLSPPSWRIRLLGAQDTLYEGESFQLQFKFSNSYPLDSPEVIFLGNVPVRAQNSQKFRSIHTFTETDTFASQFCMINGLRLSLYPLCVYLFNPCCHHVPKRFLNRAHLTR